MSKTIYDKLKANVCKVLCDDEHGTGFLISNELILTAFHVVDECEKIKVTFDNKEELEVVIHELIDDTYKELDIAILKLDKIVDFYKDIKIVDCDLIPNSKWISRGYPQVQDVTGTNLIQSGNIINQQLKELFEDKIDLQLDIGQTFDSYKGLSGAPLVIGDMICGIINSELLERGISKQLNALSIKYFKKLLEELNISVKNEFFDKSCDDISSNAWDELLKPEDVRNLKDKFFAVCPDYSSSKLNKFNRNLVEGKYEQSNYDDRDISSLKFIIFDKCQDNLINFYEINKDKDYLSKQEVEDFINNYIAGAKQIIEDKQQVYNYPKVTDDFIKKLVLDLIDECFLAFDEEGIYDD